MGRHKKIVTPEEFWSKVDRSGGPDACWEWQGGTNGRGYGAFMHDRKLTLAHRFAYTLIKGPIPDGLLVMHSCDNPPCCNPAHLSCGTYGDNIRDAIKKGRTPRGENSTGAKLTERQVAEIKAKYKFRHKSAGDIGREYGVSDWTIFCIVRGITWKHTGTPYRPAVVLPKQGTWRDCHMKKSQRQDE